MTLEELKKGEHVTVEYKLDIPQEREKYLNPLLPLPMERAASWFSA